MFVLGGGIAYLMTHTVTADDVAAEIRPERMLTQLLALRTHVDAQGAVR